MVTKANFIYLANDPTHVNPRARIYADIALPAGASVGDGVDARTLSADSVYVVEDATGVKASADVNTSGGGDTIVLTPGAGTTLKANTKYTFRVTGAAKDLDGKSFQEFSSGFTTGAIPPVSNTAAFTQVALSNVPDLGFTDVLIGKDRKLYASTLTGEIYRFAIKNDGTLDTPQIIRTVQTSNGGDRTVIGMAFDPGSTSANPILWITNNAPYDFQKGIADWSGKISRLSGANLESYKDYVVGLPRSIKDHMTNNLVFKGNDASTLYIAQGSSNSFGDPDSIWGCRAEHLLSGAVLKLNLSLLGTPSQPLNVRTDNVADGVANTDGSCAPNGTDASYSGPFYDPYAANAPLTLYATGIRNAYSLIWHSSGHLYAPTNGSANHGYAPAVPASLPASCAHRPEGHYPGPSAPAIKNATYAEYDYLFDVLPGKYYGHPNPTRCEYILNAGNVTGGTDHAEAPDYPVGVNPDPNYKRPAFIFDQHTSPNGVIEYTSSLANPVPGLNGKLLVARFSGGKDIAALTPDGSGGVTGGIDENIAGLQFSPSPLSMVEDPNTGYIYVAQLSDSSNGSSSTTIQNGTITLVRPK